MIDFFYFLKLNFKVLCNRECYILCLKKYKTTNTNQMKSNRPFFGLFESPAMVNYTDLWFFLCVLAKIPKYSSHIR
jgi:hypothetical protein